MIPIDKKSEEKIKKTIEKTINNHLPLFDFDKNDTNLDFICGKCNAKYTFDVMAIYFDSLQNKEKFLVNPICPVCGEKENFNYMPKTLHFLSFLFKEKHMPEAVMQEPLMTELLEKYPDEKIDNFDNLDEEGLDALDRGDYEEVFRIFMQFVYMNSIHHMGFEFIAYAYYETRDFDKALWFMERAVERAEYLCKRELLDKGLLSVLKKNYEYMKRKQLITRWWENL